VFEPDNQAVATPKLDVVPIDKLLCPNRSIRVTVANEGSGTNQMTVMANSIGAIFRHRENPRWMV